MSTTFKKLQLAEMLNSGVLCRKLIENLPYRISVKDTNLTYVFCNEAYAQYFNITPDDILGMTDYDLFSKKIAERIITDENEILHSGAKKEITETHVISGRESFSLATKTPLRNDNGDIIGLQVVLHDITNDKRRTESLAFLIKSLEDQLSQREKMNAAQRIDLERVTARLNQREAEFSDLHERTTKQMSIYDAHIKKIKYCLQSEATKLLNLVELLQKFFAQFQVQMNSAKHLTDRAIRDEDHQKGNN